MSRNFHLETEFSASVSRVWPLVSHTALINRMASRPPVNYSLKALPDGRTQVIGRQRLGPIQLVYEEPRFEWVFEQGYEVERIFRAGPVRRLVMKASLEARAADQSLLRMDLLLEPSSWGRPLMGMIGRQAMAAQGRVFKRFEQALAGASAEGGTSEEARGEMLGAQTFLQMATADTLPQVNQQRLVHRQQQAKQAPELQRASAEHAGVVEGVLDRIAHTLERAPDSQLTTMRPLAFARRWESPRQATIEAFLFAARAGLLVMRWDVLCPHCRGDSRQLASLSEAEREGFCTACNLHFEVDLARSLEAVFGPHPVVREVVAEEYCAAGPGENAHILLRQLLQPGETRSLELQLPEGRHRVRVTGSEDLRFMTVPPERISQTQGEEDPASVAGETAPIGAGNDLALTGQAGQAGPALQTLQVAAIVITDQGFGNPDLELIAGAAFALRLENQSSRCARLSIETSDWIRDALPASELTALQRFRELFGTEALAPGVQLSVGHITLLFTDLVSSTQMYEALGDARAFRLVWEHFDGLKAAIARNSGAMVKTIGDAVMAVFTDPSKALCAALEMQVAVEEACASLDYGWPPALKVGLVDGAAIAVNLNERLDYFGRTVNLAARVQGAAKGGEVLVDEQTLARAGGEAAVQAAGWIARGDEICAKGFAAPIKVLRLTRRP